MPNYRRNAMSFVVQTLKLTSIHLFIVLSILPQLHNSLIITSVLAGDKKFKTISFDSKFLKPLTFEKDLPSTEFRRHRTVRPPKFDIDVNIPIKLPLEDEYAYEEPKKPVESHFFFQSGEINEPSYGKGPAKYKDYERPREAAYASASEDAPNIVGAPAAGKGRGTAFNLMSALAKSIKFHPQIEYNGQKAPSSEARSDNPMVQPALPQQQQQHQLQLQLPQQDQLLQQQSQQHQMQQQQQPVDLSNSASNYQQQQYPNKGDSYREQEFVPGGFINLQLSGPKGGPKATYEDYDKERWHMQLSQTAGAMPYPILNYHQLQNFYGGLGTFTNGLADNRYVQESLLDKFKSSLMHWTSKFHFG